VIARGFKRLRDDVALDLFERTKAGESGRASGSSANIFRKILGREFRALAENDSAFECVAQFTDISGPEVSRKEPAGSGVEFPIGAMVNGAERCEQMIGERQDVRAAFAQRRNRDGENVEAEEKIFAELARGDGSREVGVRDGDEARLDVQRFGAAETLERALLQNAEQFCLRVGRKRGDFVEDDGAGATEFETAEFTVHSAGERAAFVTEELALDERGRKRGAIDFEERRVATRTEFMNETRKMVFARAGFASDKERGGGCSDFLREVEQTARSGVFGDPGKAVGHGDIVAGGNES